MKGKVVSDDTTNLHTPEAHDAFLKGGEVAATTTDEELDTGTEDEGLDDEVEGDEVDGDGEGEGEGGKSAAQELEEVEYEGKKYTLPKELREALLRQSDYTRKTQEISEQRRSIEERARTFQEATRVQQQNLVDIAQIVALNDRLAQYEQIDFTTLRMQDADRAAQLLHEYQQLRAARDGAVTTLQSKVKSQEEATAAQRAKQLEEANSALSRDIPGWGRELAGKLVTFAANSQVGGFTPEEVAQVSDPRLFKLLHHAYVGDAAIKELAALKKALKQKNVQPLTQVNSGSAPVKSRRTTDATGDKLSTEEWMRREMNRKRK